MTQTIDVITVRKFFSHLVMFYFVVVGVLAGWSAIALYIFMLFYIVAKSPECHILIMIMISTTLD